MIVPHVLDTLRHTLTTLPGPGPTLVAAAVILLAAGMLLGHMLPTTTRRDR